MQDYLSNHEAFIGKIARLLLLDNRKAEAKLLASAEYRIEQTDHDNWNGGIDIYVIFLEVPTSLYAEAKSDIEKIQNHILQKAQFLLRTSPGISVAAVHIDPAIQYDSNWRDKIDILSPEALLLEIERQRDLMISVATGGPAINSVNDQYVTRQEVIQRSLRGLGLSDPNPYTDLWHWYKKWRSGDLPTYQSRREYIAELYQPLISRLRRDPNGAIAIFVEPTGWAKIDRSIGEIRRVLEQASSEEQYQTVGLLCRETLISLGQTVYDPQKHPSEDGIQISNTDAKRMLGAYISNALAGSTNEISRKHAKAALDLANDLQHKRTATFRQAALCAEATTGVVNLLAIISGRRDP